MKTMGKRIKKLEAKLQTCINELDRYGVDVRNLSKQEEETIAKAANILNIAEKRGSVREADGLAMVKGTGEELGILAEAVNIVTKRQGSGMNERNRRKEYTY